MNRLLCLLGLVLVFGCKTYQEETPFQVAPAGKAISAKDAMRAWIDYKHTTIAQNAKVKDAWDRYCAAIQAEKTSTNINRAISLTAITESKVIQVIVQSLPPAQVMALQNPPAPVIRTNRPVRVRKVVK